MSAVTTRSRGGYVDRPSSASLADVVNIILDKGLVIDATCGCRWSGSS
ncbi:hypothetical protein [Georgenia sp. SUBG003]